jgi:hypothetical protein
MATGLFSLRQVNQAIRQSAWPNSRPTWVEYLVVGGGGGAVYGGGGGGGVLTGIYPVSSGTSYTVTVGAGGTAGGTPTNGVSSVFGNITALGGGKSGDPSGFSGGSGGGGWNQLPSGIASTNGNGAQGTFGQGNASSVAAYFCGAGGGGAGTFGTGGVSSAAGGNGGEGIASSISGAVTAYGGGGGGFNGTTKGLGGVGGGGAAGAAYAPINGTANTGGGGGGCDYVYASGGSGIVVVRYPGSVQFYTGGIVWASASGYVVHWFLSTSTLVPTTPTALTVQPAYPVAIGASYGGGYFAGQIKDGGVIYNLVVAPKASGYVQSGYAWDSTGGGSTTGATSVTNGQTNTATIPAIARYAAAQYVKGLNIGGYTDWYLPSIEELGIAWFNLKPLTNDNYGGPSAYTNFTGNVPPYQTVANWPSATIPAQTTVTNFKTGGSEAWAGDHSWTSTETSATQAAFLYWGTGVPGYQSSSDKTQSGYSIRGFRRVVA